MQETSQVSILIAAPLLALAATTIAARLLLAAGGYISRMCVEAIHVPLAFRKLFEAVLSGNRSGEKSCCYTVQIAYGSLFEPWLRSVSVSGMNQ